jgi:hypothetical protein
MSSTPDESEPGVGEPCTLELHLESMMALGIPPPLLAIKSCFVPGELSDVVGAEGT